MNQKVIDVRKDALRSYITVFSEEIKRTDGIDLIIDIPEAASNICDLYFRYAEEVVRPVVSSGIIQNYKIISYLELAVLRVEPVTLDDADETAIAWYNAKLALHVAVTFLLEWNDIDPLTFNQLITSDGQLKDFLNEHLTWLAGLDCRYYFPGFSNMQVWRLFHYLVIDRIKTIS